MTYRTRTLLACVAIVLGIGAVFLLAISLSPALVGMTAGLDKGSEERAIPADLGVLARLLREWAGLFFSAAAVVGLASRFERVEQINWTPLSSALWTVVCSGFLLWYLSRLSYDAPWYPLDVLTEGSRVLEVFSRRPLLIWPARWIRHAAPNLSYLRVYWIVQAPVILATMILVRKWSEQFVDGSRAFVGQILTVFLLAPMFSYYTFYDVGIVFFYTAGLLALWKRAYFWLVPVVAIGALNHENTLLLVFVAALLLWEEPRRVLLQVVGWSLAGWFAVRLAISVAIPMPKTVHFRILTNLWELLHAPGPMLFTGLAWLPLVLLTVLGWSAGPARLRKMAALAIPLLAVTYLFGKFREARQVDAYIPVAVGFGLSLLRTKAADSLNLSDLPSNIVDKVAGNGYD